MLSALRSSFDLLVHDCNGLFTHGVIVHRELLLDGYGLMVRQRNISSVRGHWKYGELAQLFEEVQLVGLLSQLWLKTP
ncbi:hypothetical protein Tco_1254713 [Tanacetum coccineum]